MDSLDDGRAEADRSSHGDDLRALQQVAAMHPDAATFEHWLREMLAAPAPVEGALVTLSTVHRIKGQEWPVVVVFGADADAFPHRLADRRGGGAPGVPRRHHAGVGGGRGGGGRVGAVAVRRRAGRIPPAGSGSGRGGRVTADGTGRERGRGGGAARAASARGGGGGAGAATTSTRRCGRRCGPGGATPRPAPGCPPTWCCPTPTSAPSACGGRRRWSSCAQCRGLGPTKLERYGDELLSVLEQVGAT